MINKTVIDLNTHLASWPQAARWIVSLYDAGISVHPDDRGADLIDFTTKKRIFTDHEANLYDHHWEDATARAREAGQDIDLFALTATERVTSTEQGIGYHDGAENDRDELMRDFPGLTVDFIPGGGPHGNTRWCTLSGPEKIVLEVLENVFGHGLDAGEQIDKGVVRPIPLARKTVMLTITFEVDGDVTEDDLDLLAAHAAVQVEEPADAEGDDADFDTHNVSTSLWVRS
jgi:hypothetical protein